MSLSWVHRKTRLQGLLKSTGDEDEDGLALDRLLHGQLVIGKTGSSNILLEPLDCCVLTPFSAKTAEIDTLRFQDQDLQVLGTLEYGQFGVVSRV